MSKIGKRAQIMALYLPLMTLFMCGLVVGIHMLQKADLQNSLVSPVEVLELQDQKEIFELRERALIIESAKEVGWGNDIENKFYELLESEEEEIRGFLFSDLNYGDRGKDWGFQSAGAEVQFLKTNKIYEFDFENNVLKVKRNKLGKSFRLAVDEKSKINFVVDVGYIFEKMYSLSGEDLKEREIVSLEKAVQERKLIFIPINWETGKQDFDEKTEASFNYFSELIKIKGDKIDYYPYYYFDNFEIDNLDNLTKAVEDIENHVFSLGISYNKKEDVIIAYAKDSFDGALGFIHTPYNQVAFISSAPEILSHELGHALFGYCEEYEYFEITCLDSVEHQDLVKDIIKENLESFTNFLWGVGLGEISEEEGYENFITHLDFPDEYVDKYPSTPEGEEQMLEDLLAGIIDCSFEGWLAQNYEKKYFYENFKDEYPRRFNGCQNLYPTCCLDNPHYAGDNNAEGIHCIPFMTRSNLHEDDPCMGSSCGKKCRSIMGGYSPGEELEELGITSYSYPV